MKLLVVVETLNGTSIASSIASTFTAPEPIPHKPRPCTPPPPHTTHHSNPPPPPPPPPRGRRSPAGPRVSGPQTSVRSPAAPAAHGTPPSSHPADSFHPA